MQEIAEPSAVTTENRPSTAGMTTKVVKGSLWTLAGQVAPLGVSLFATPFVIRLLGAEGYGVLILVSLIPTYLGFADLGMGLASTKFASEAYAAGDADREARTVRTAAVIALCTSVPVAVLVFLFSGRLVTLFNVPEHLAWEASAALKVASVTFVLNFLNQIFNTPQLTRLRMDLNTFVNSGFRILGIVATPIVIYLGGGILGAVIVLFAAALLTLGGHVYMSGRLLPPLFDISLDRNAIRPIVKFGSSVASAFVASVLLMNGEKIVLTKVVSVEALAFYSVAFTLAMMMTSMSSSLTQSLIPAFSQLLDDDMQSRLAQLYSRALRVNLVVVLPMLISAFVVAKEFFTIWAGEAFGRESTFPFYILLIGIAAAVNNYAAVSLLLATGRADLISKLYWAELVPYLFLATILTIALGAVGAAIAWSTRAIVDTLIFTRLARNWIKGSFIIFPRGTLRLLALPTFLGPPVLTALGTDRISIVSILVLVVGLSLYTMFTWKGLLLPDERRWITNRLNVALSR